MFKSQPDLKTVQPQNNRGGYNILHPHLPTVIYNRVKYWNILNLAPKSRQV